MTTDNNDLMDRDIILQDMTMTFCRVSAKITNEGMKVGFMYREEPDNSTDSGWRFLSGTETQKYVDDENNSQIIDLETIIKIDQAVAQYITRPFGTELERIEGTDNFQIL